MTEELPGNIYRHLTDNYSESCTSFWLDRTNRVGVFNIIETMYSLSAHIPLSWSPSSWTIEYLFEGSQF